MEGCVSKRHNNKKGEEIAEYIGEMRPSNSILLDVQDADEWPEWNVNVSFKDKI